jgi:hypothetical protein
LSLYSLLFPPNPIFFFREISVPALAAGQTVIYDEETALRNYRKFTPFSNMQLINTSQCNLEMLLDYFPDRKLIILAGGTKALRNQPFNSFSIKNTDPAVATTADEVFIELETIR